MMGRHTVPAPDRYAAELDALYADLIWARRAGDTVKADLIQASINHILDNWSDLHG
jgi:hypothetical protein